MIPASGPRRRRKLVRDSPGARSGAVSGTRSAGATPSTVAGGDAASLGATLTVGSVMAADMAGRGGVIAGETPGGGTVGRFDGVRLASLRGRSRPRPETSIGDSSSHRGPHVVAAAAFSA